MMLAAEKPYSVGNPVTVEGPDGYYYTFFTKRNPCRAGELGDLYGTRRSVGGIGIPSLASLPCYFKKWNGVYNFSNSGYVSTSYINRPLFGFLVYKKHTTKDNILRNGLQSGSHVYMNYLEYVPRVIDNDFEQETHSFEPMYEVINPTITRIEGTNTALMTFWTNAIPFPANDKQSSAIGNFLDVTYDVKKVGYYDVWTDTFRNVFNGSIISSTEINGYCCGALIEWREVKASADSNQRVLVPLVTKVFVIQADIHPKIDISAGGGAGGTYEGPFKLSLASIEESSSTSSGTTVTNKLVCTGGNCWVNGTVYSVLQQELDIPNITSTTTREVLLHYHQTLNSNGSVASRYFEVILNTYILSCSSTDSYYHLGRISQGLNLEQYCYGSPQLFTFQVGC